MSLPSIILLLVLVGRLLVSTSQAAATNHTPNVDNNFLLRQPQAIAAMPEPFDSKSEEDESPEEEEEEEVEEEKGENRKTVCPSCLSREDLRRLRIEKIKQQILTKLRLKDRPNATIAREELPTPLSYGDISSGRTLDSSKGRHSRYDYYARTEHVIVFPDESSRPCSVVRHHPSECLHFSQAFSFPEGEITSAELWVYKLIDPHDHHHDGNHTFVIHDLVTDPKTGLHRRIHSIHVETSFSSGWMKFGIKPTLRRWRSQWQSNAEHWLEVVCRTCGRNAQHSPISMATGQRPFLVLTIGNRRETARTKRSNDCEADTTHCCRESLYVSFEEIGWSDWILQPQGYTANYCRGSCIEDVSIPMSDKHYTSILQRYAQSRNLTPSQRQNISPCCTPTRMSEISLLYQSENTLYQTNLPDMVVEACGCS